MKEKRESAKEPAREPAKIFCDLIFDYPDLKYIFEYGFYWDDDVTKVVLSKKSQKVRELTNILADSVYKNCVSMPWWKTVSGEKNKKSGRLLVWQNHYRLAQNRWFLEIYGCCGKFNQPEAERFLKNCSKDGYMACLDSADRTTDTCTYRRICRMEQEKELFHKFAHEENSGIMLQYKENSFYKQFVADYRDVLDSEKGLKKNLWTREMLGEDYPDFLDMLRFFSEFAPLSVLGSCFLRRIDDGAGDGGEPAVLVRNLPPDFGLEQEYVYRCLYAMVNNRFIKYEDKEYLPQKLLYQDRGIDGVPEHLYLQAMEKTDSGEYVVHQLPLFHGLYVEAGKKAVRDGTPSKIIPVPSEKTADFQVVFYSHDDAGYLRERQEEHWRKDIIRQEKQPKFHTMESPYHPDIQEWQADKVVYRIAERDIPGFLLFVRSFGDFALLKEEGDLTHSREVPRSAVTRGRASNGQSLLNIYNSAELAESLRKDGIFLPPRGVELEWLDFILERYPNMCRIFLDKEGLDRIRELLGQELNDAKRGWFDEKYYDCAVRVRDIREKTGEKYAGIWRAIRQHRILSCEYKDQTTAVFPYAFEHDVMRYLSRGSQEPLSIMCYNLKEKRNVNIRYRNIRIKKSSTEAEYLFSDLDKLYHVLAYGIRCGMEEKPEIHRKAAALTEVLWKTDTRGGDNYNRCIRKKWQKKRDYKEEFDVLQEQMRKTGRKEDLDFLNNVFSYYRDYSESEESLQMQYQTFLLSCFSVGCQRLWSPRSGREVKRCLDSITQEEIWEWIRGAEQDGIVNEIAYYNEKLKNAILSFVLKKEMKSEIDLVYRLFGNFICAGEMLSDGRIRFTITYEGFYYRKIHMALMALEDRIESIEPKSAAEIIQKRAENREKNKNG